MNLIFVKYATFVITLIRIFNNEKLFMEKIPFWVIQIGMKLLESAREAKWYKLLYPFQLAFKCATLNWYLNVSYDISSLLNSPFSLKLP